MSEFPPPAVAAGAARDGQEALTPERIETVLADFRRWLEQAAAAGPVSAPGAPSAGRLDLSALLSQFVALRHEVNLQTRATRAQQEQNAEALRRLGEAVDALQQEDEAAALVEEQATEEQLRPLVKTLVDVHDALALAAPEAQRLRETILPALETLAPAAPPRKPGLWARLLRPGPRRDEDAKQAREAVEQVRRLLDSLVTGYAMSLRRVERALERAGLEPIAAAGHPFDPEQMEVLEVVADSGRPAGEVISEVRRGYLWKGRVFRYAQVRVAKP
jgi:molecular chaperone GrpE